MPGTPLIESGPYRLMRHPNYAIVAVELALVPLALGLPRYALVSVILYAGTALLRVQVENSALGGSAGGAPQRRGPDHALDRWAETRKRPHTAGAFIRFVGGLCG